MVGLLTYNGQLQYPLSTDEDCCCSNLDCPDCCAQITSGALIGGEIRQFLTVGGNSIEVTITTPSGGRTVCQDDVIRVEFEFTDANGAPIPGTAFANWDVAWARITPQSQTGIVTSLGYIKWDDPGTNFAFSLKYSPCYNAEHSGLGMIQVGSESLGLLVEIEVTACPIQNCCWIEPVCERCCFRLEGGVRLDDNGFMFYARNPEDSELYIVAQVDSVHPVKKTICFDALFTVKFWIGSRNPNIIENLSADVSVEFDAALFVPIIPDADEAPPLGDSGIVKWFDSNEIHYSLTLTISCKPLRLPGTTVITVVDNTSGERAMLGIRFTPCDVHEGCPCCFECPDYCCLDCHFPVTMRRCESNDFSLGPAPWWETGGATQIVNFRTELTTSADFFCGGTTNVMTITQAGESFHHVTCDSVCEINGVINACTKSTCGFNVPVDFSCPGFGQGNVGIGYRTNPIIPHLPPYVWIVGEGHVYPFWNLGRTSYSGDCNGATASGSYLSGGGVVINWTTSFTVVRILPTPAPICS